jgi:signal transduction histidine kinase/ActR/RegA family two-component response regulator
MKFRTHLALMAVGILLPIVILSTLALLFLMRAEREAAQRGVRETARAVALAVDRELGAAEAALRVLATSRPLARGDLRDFHEQASAARTNDSSWIVLFDSAAAQVVNTRFDYGAQLARASDPKRVHQVIESQQPSVSDLHWAPLMRREILTVDVPVPLDNGRRYVLAQAFFPEYFSRIFRERSLPSGWIGAINDKQGRTIARTYRAEDFVGKPISPVLAEASQGRFEGELTHRSREGIPIYDFFTRSTSGWLVVVGVPTAVLEAPGRRAAVLAGIGALVAMGTALGVAFLLGRRLSKSLGDAAQAAVGLGRGEPAYRRATSIEEIRNLYDALAGASETLVRERSARERAEAERERLFGSEQAARRAAEAQSRAKDEFLAMLGHELRNPLAAVSNAVQLLELEQGASKQMVLARGIISRQTRQLVHLIDDLLDVGRVITGKIFLQREPVDLAAAAHSALSTLGAANKTARHSVTIDASPVYVDADRTRLEQIITNLVSNAVTYTPENGSVHVRVWRDDADAVLSVSDNGIGIEQHELERVFDLFFQAKGDLHRKGGLGIGLTLVRHLVELHGGTISVNSDGPGRGATFTVRLAATEHVKARTVERKVQPGDTPRSILLIEDNHDARESLKAILMLDGHTVHEASDGREGLRAAQELRPDIAIVDIGLPEMNGYEVAKALRDSGNSDMLLIALTGYGQPEDERRATEAGFDAHVVKPADIDSLRTIISSKGAALAG